MAFFAVRSALFTTSNERDHCVPLSTTARRKNRTGRACRYISANAKRTIRWRFRNTTRLSRACEGGREGEGPIRPREKYYLLWLSPRLTSRARPGSPLSPDCPFRRAAAYYTFPSRPRTGCCLSDAVRRVLHARLLYSSAEWRRARQKPWIRRGLTRSPEIVERKKKRWRRRDEFYKRVV